MDIKEQIEELVENYNKCLENKQKMHDMSQEENAGNDKKDNRSDSKKG